LAKGILERWIFQDFHNREWTQPSPKRYGGQAANEREFKSV
jgi:hypothetical protein